MKINQITVRAGRVVPHPLHSYGNIKSDLEIVATIEDGDDADQVRRELQMQVESQVEQHVAELKEGIRDLAAFTTSQKRIGQLEKQLADVQDELERATEELADLPLLFPHKPNN